MKDWRQEISDVIRGNCDHGAETSSLVSTGCSRCHQMFRDILEVMDGAIEELRTDLRGGTPFQNAMDRFRRSIPTG